MLYQYILDNYLLCLLFFILGAIFTTIIYAAFLYHQACKDVDDEIAAYDNEYDHFKQ